MHQVGPSDVNWDAVVTQALERSDRECPICLGDLQRDGRARLHPAPCCVRESLLPVPGRARRRFRKEAKRSEAPLLLASSMRLCRCTPQLHPLLARSLARSAEALVPLPSPSPFPPLFRLGRRRSLRRGKGNAWLSCSHVFHTECLRTFEAYAEVRSGCRTCPLCRSSYVKKCL